MTEFTVEQVFMTSGSKHLKKADECPVKIKTRGIGKEQHASQRLSPYEKRCFELSWFL